MKFVPNGDSHKIRATTAIRELYRKKIFQTAKRASGDAICGNSYILFSLKNDVFRKFLTSNSRYSKKINILEIHFIEAP
ncbi:hypothetical protein BWD14_02255 [Leptospira santarosai]|uniref:Uncharacterized protein n=1 Tax=Leptospira santarosai TaxID=28183 RepID=A0AB73LV99_9LEPT|nr:hypothetical protein BWD14_02255 [Leptospira santarosai]